MKMTKVLVQVGGWYGAGAIILAYALVSFNVLEPTSWQYQILNLTGAGGILAETLSKKDYQPALLNLFWLTIAAVALLQIVL